MNLNKNIKKESPYKIYSESFKKMVVQEVESGRLTKEGAKRKYNIGGNTTILNWCRKYGILKDLGLKVNITMKNEADEKKAMKLRIRELESSLANAHLKIEAQDIMINIAEEMFEIPIRKKVGAKQLSKCNTSDQK